MPFATVAVPFASYAALPSPAHRWVLTCLARYTDRSGLCWPSMRRLAADARMSLSTVCRRLAELASLGVFHRERRPGGRYRYQLAEAYRLGWRAGVSAVKQGVSERASHKDNQSKHYEDRGKANKTQDKDAHDDSLQWAARIAAWQKSGGKFWPAFAGPRPNEPGCWVPPGMLSNRQSTHKE